MQYYETVPVNIGQAFVKHWLAGSVKHQLILVYLFLSAMMNISHKGRFDTTHPYVGETQ